MIASMHRSIARRFASGALLVAVLVGRSAVAQNETDPQRAERLFKEATALADQGDFVHACPKFEESMVIDPGLGTQFNLALCYEKVGQLASAWRNFREAERLAHASGRMGRAQASHDKVAEIGARVAHLVLRSPSQDVSIKVDGDEVAVADWSFYPVDPGEHRISVTGSARQPWQTRVTIAAADPSSPGPAIDVAIPVLAPAEIKTRIVTREVSNARKTAGFVIGGVGVASVVAAIVTGIIVLDQKSTAAADCTPTCKTQEGRDAVALGNTLLPINAVAWGVGIVGIATGSLLLLLKPKAAQSAVTVSPSIGRGQGGLAVGMSF